MLPLCFLLNNRKERNVYSKMPGSLNKKWGRRRQLLCNKRWHPSFMSKEAGTVLYSLDNKQSYRECLAMTSEEPHKDLKSLSDEENSWSCFNISQSNPI
jgi:hypothetical protein